MALAQKDHYLACFESRKDGRQRKRKGVFKGMASNRLSNEDAEFSPLEVFPDRLNRHIKTDNRERN